MKDSGALVEYDSSNDTPTRVIPSLGGHDFSYSASGATITATCANVGHCPLTNNTATLTIAAPLHVTYGDGNEAAARITDANSIKGGAAVSYQKKTGETTWGTATTTAPTDAGTYKASITLGTGAGAATASVQYTAAKANNSAPTGLAGIGVTVSGASDGKITGVDDTMEYKLSTAADYTAVPNGATRITGLAEGTYDVRYKESDNFNASTVASVTINVDARISFDVTFKVKNGNGLFFGM